MTTKQPFRVGIVTGAREPYPELVRRWKLAEELGFDTVWVTDHFMDVSADEDPAMPIFEAWTLIPALATATERIRFGVIVSGNTYRNPALLAKQAVTVDHVSNGRLELGIGAGWAVREHAAYGYDLPGAGELVDRFREALTIIQGLQHEDQFDFRGKHYWVDNAPFQPKAIQQPQIPLLVGASGPRMLKITAEYADIWNTRRPPEGAGELNRLLDEKCAEVGRDPSEIMRSIWPGENPWTSVDNVCQVIDAYYNEGFTDFVFSWPTDENVAVMESFTWDVLPDLRQRYG